MTLLNIRCNPAFFLIFFSFAILHLQSCKSDTPPQSSLAPETILKDQGVEQNLVLPNGTEVQIPTADNLKLYGNFYKNDDFTGQLPGAVIIGSADGYDTSSTRYLASMLASRGIVCLTFYPRGVVGSSANISGGQLQGHSYEWQKDDALAAMKELLKDKSVDPLRVGFIGMDEGAELALLASCSYSKPSFCITGSLPIIGAAEKLTRGFNDPIKNELAGLQAQYRDGKMDFVTLQSKQAALASNNRLRSYRLPLTTDDGYWQWFDSWRSIGSVALLPKLHGPTLMLFGALENGMQEAAKESASDLHDELEGNIVVQTTDDTKLTEAYHKLAISDKTIGVIASFMRK